MPPEAIGAERSVRETGDFPGGCHCDGWMRVDGGGGWVCGLRMGLEVLIESCGCRSELQLGLHVTLKWLHDNQILTSTNHTQDL